MTSTLNSILKSSEETHSSLGKRPAAVKSQPQGDDLFQALAQTLSALHQQLSTEPPDVRAGVEIEVRVGLISLSDHLERATPNIPGSGAVQIEPELMRRRGLRFVSGVSAPVFDAVKDEVGRKYGTTERSSKEVVFVYDSGRLRDQRVIMDGTNPPYFERKETRQQINFQLPAAPYDLRVQASLEQTMEPMQGSDPPEGWSGRRTKRRFSWKSPSGLPEEDAWLWQADLTLVEIVSSHKGLHEVREVELELLPRARDRWLALSDPEEVIAMTSQVATHLSHLLESINPIEPVSTISNPVAEQHEESRNAAVAACAQLKRHGKGSAFPGAQPVNMCKRNVPDVQRGSYYIAEKTDGVRYLMLAVPGPAGNTCVLVDRSMNVFRVTGGAFLAEVLGMGTILDGELVHNRSMMKAIFVAFDILRYRDRNVMSLNFIERLTTLSQNVMTAYFEQIQGAGTEPDAHLMLVMKSFYPRRKIMDLFRKVHMEGRHRIFKDDGRTLHHKTDGIIFQPDAPYKMGTDTSLLKWKWADLASVDLRAYAATGTGVGGGGGGDVRLCSEAGQHGEEVDLSKSVHLSDHDKARLMGDMEGSRSVIAEVALDPGSGLWVYMGLRPDKDRPNFITTVISTMVEVAEGLSEEELKYRMLSDTPASDDWFRQEATMRKRAVQWQFKRASPPQQQQQQQQKRPRSSGDRNVEGGSVSGGAGNGAAAAAAATQVAHGGRGAINGHG